MKIGIVSDSHDRTDALGNAVRDAAAHGARAIIHCGDLIGAHTLQSAIPTGLPLHLIHGNNIGDQAALHRLSMKHPGVVRLTPGGVGFAQELLQQKSEPFANAVGWRSDECGTKG